MTLKQGALIYDSKRDRYDIRFDIDDYYGGLHCGQCFEVFTKSRWRQTRIEMNAEEKWYLINVKCGKLDGLRVRMYFR